jgi:hypothetical protein
MTPSSSVSLVILETRYHGLATMALQHWTRRINFKEVLVFSDKNLLPGSKWVPIAPLTDVNRDYGDIMVRGMWPFLNSDYMILINWDTPLRDSNLWSEDFFDYDYIGSMWPWQAPHNDNPDHCGISWRSKRLLEAMRYPSVESVTDSVPYHVSHQMEQVMRNKFQIRMSEQDMNRRFVLELDQNDTGNSFAVRGLWNIINCFSRDVSEGYILGAPAVMWDDVKGAHELIAALVNKNYIDLLQYHAATIKRSANYGVLINWLQQETFPEQQTVLRILS